MKEVIMNNVLFGFVVLLFLNLGCKETKAKDEVVSIEGPQVVKSSSGIDINYTISGHGDHTLLFVHGWSCDQTYWDKQVSHFKKNYKVVTLDLGGHGKSGSNRDIWTMDAFADDVLDVVNAIEYKEISLIGHSMGSVVVLNAASKMEKQPQSVVFVDYFKDKPGPIPSQEQMETRTTGFKADFVNTTKGFVKNMFLPTSDSTLVANIVEHMSSANQEVAVSAVKSMMRNDNSAGFQNLMSKDMNTHIINSDVRPVNNSYFDSIGFKAHTMKETAHFLMIEKSREFNELLEEIVSDGK